MLLVLPACKHPLAIVGEGDIVDLNGSDFGCTLEQYQADDAACLGNEVVDVDYHVNYAAIPRPGWKFVRWEGNCGATSESDNCRFDASAAAVSAFDEAGVDTSSTKITAVFELENDQVSGIRPAIRGGAPAVWIGDENRAVFFGGMSPITADTWELDLSKRRWRELTSEFQTAPLPRCHHSFVSDKNNTNMLLFGGFSNAGRFNDLWRYDNTGNRWERVAHTGSVPARRCLHVSTIIESTGEMFLYGGIQGGGGLSSDFFEDTYLYNPQSQHWRQINVAGPGKRSGPIAFYASSENAVFLWGGKQFNILPNSLWRFDVVTEHWSEVATTGDIPAGREDPIHFWDDASNSLVMASGGDVRGSVILFNDMYRLNLATRSWERLSFSEAPPPRWRGTLAYEPINRKGYLFGGWKDFGGRDALNDLWVLDMEQLSWSRLQ